MTSMQLAAIRILADKLRHYHLTKCGIVSRRSEAEHIVAMLQQAAETAVSK